MEFLRFIFSSFWVWLGTICLLMWAAYLLELTLNGLAELVKACKRSRKVTACQIGARWHIEVENASGDDVRGVMVSAAYGHDGEEAETCTDRE